MMSRDDKQLTLKDIQAFSLEILKDVHRFCIANKIMYSVSDGTLLGTIRHKGFIPWDDDIDIIMPRPFFERFCETYKSDRFKLAYRPLNKDCYVCFARVYDDTRTRAKCNLPWCKKRVGCWIDILPADGAPDDPDIAKEYYAENHELWHNTLVMRKKTMRALTKNKPISWNLYCIAWKVIDMFHLLIGRSVDRAITGAKRIRFGETGYWSQYTTTQDNCQEHNRIETFTHTIELPFEDTTVMVMNGYDEVLRNKYKNYWELPPVEKRTTFNSGNRFYWK